LISSTQTRLAILLAVFAAFTSVDGDDGLWLTRGWFWCMVITG